MKIGDGSVRTALYEAASAILTRPVKGSDLKGWVLAVARRAGPEAQSSDQSNWKASPGSNAKGDRSRRIVSTASRVMGQLVIWASTTPGDREWSSPSG
ncbi:hypothetical protein [Sinorhizobium medicae]|uniref:hypothetical protein n=1 Tax=Sinorhizobium medicae TaxID=110321 RepID=UPI000482343D|nr:hypothetical protein [Sinorhizobium medicae]MDX0525067.1 hypothetical protein [Sinorhizobium medicae]MDX0636393.1 hypothetical protein [Sinorhizobium medicae]MDX0698560.1 hypothetical protein [Sinorhizobium medicae]MDX0748257.1 hypothetical protein [Sinorhizobium medicae]MDX0772472.1 hypothetical protein [Sinorhizobium medicae]